MEFTVEDLSAVKKRVHITVPAEEVAAALAAAVVTIGQDLQLDGFRKGKVPASVIRKRFGSSIEKEARESLINVHINEVVGKTGVNPVSDIDIDDDGKELAGGEPFSYSMEFEVVPGFDLPKYEGLDVEQEAVGSSESSIDTMIRSLTYRMSTLEPVPGNEPAKQGQIAVIDFEFLEGGEPLPDYKSSSFELPIGGGQALKEFENLVTTIPVGHTATGPITFPEDFIAPELAGKTLEARVTVHAVKERKLPEVDDELARRLGYKDVEELREKCAHIASDVLEYMNKSQAEQALVDTLVKQVDFEVPECIVRRELRLLISDHITRLEVQGKRVVAVGEGMERLNEEFKPRAEQRAREKIILLAIAEKEKLEVTPQEMARAVGEGANKFGDNPREYLRKLERTGMLQQLHEHLLCDKAMDLVYERANVKMIAPVKAEDEKSEAAAEASGE